VSLEGIVVGLLAIVVGGVWMTYGLKAFFILLPFWAFFVGLLAGAQWSAEFLGEGFFGTVTSWAIGLVAGLVLGLLAYFWYYAAIILLGATVGYTLGSGFLVALGFDGFLSIVLGVIVGVLLGIAVLVLNVPALLVIVLSAFGGAAAVVNGFWILLGQIQLDAIDGGLAEGLIKGGAITFVAWLLLAAFGIWYQMRDIGRDFASLRMAADIDRSAYRVS
jgi:Domain of unknown function (DUF4203)